MPKYCETDDLSCWVGVRFIEQYEALKTKEEKAEWYSTRLGSVGVLRETAEEDFLQWMISDTPNPFAVMMFASAVANSINWAEVLEVIKKTIDDYDCEDKCEGCGVGESKECKPDCSYQAKRREEEGLL
jgi:hypothetical protein